MDDFFELYAPTKAQYKIHSSPHKFNVICFGRQSGKSTYGVNKLLFNAWEKDRGVFWYVAPSFRLAKQMYERTKYAIEETPGVMKRKSDSELLIELESESKIVFLSGEQEGNLLGETVDGVVIDECREQKKSLWTHKIMPMLGTTGGWADFLSTPNGFDWFYDLYQKHLTDKSWGAFHAPSTSNPFWTDEMIAEAKASMSDDLFAQEIMAEFRDIGSGTCYINFSHDNYTTMNPFANNGEEYNKYLPILVACDFNLSPVSWVLGQHNQRQIYWNDEISLHRSHTAEAAEVLASKVAGHEAGIVIIGDASGNAGQRAAAGQSDYDILKQVLKRHNIKYTDKTPDSNPGIKDRVNNVNAALKSADGSVHMWFNPRCKVAIKDMQRRSWKTGAASLAFDNSDPDVGHMSDAVGYAVSVLAPVKSVGDIGKMRIIMRTV